jgi:hypothetical protein
MASGATGPRGSCVYESVSMGRVLVHHGLQFGEQQLLLMAVMAGVCGHVARESVHALCMLGLCVAVLYEEALEAAAGPRVLGCVCAGIVLAGVGSVWRLAESSR